MALSKKQRSPRRLNNKGVFFLEVGRYEDASRCFAMAIKSSPSPLQWQAQKIRVPLNLGRETPKLGNEPTTEPPKRISPILEDVLVQTQQEEKPPGGLSDGRSTDSCSAPPQKRRRRLSDSSAVVSSTSLAAYNLGRPLWIPPKQQRTAALDSKVLPATSLYNLGLSFHLMAIREAEITRRLFYTRKALSLYKLAAEAMVKMPLSITVQSPTFAVILHNMSHVYSTMMESHEEASRCQGGLATVLRLMRVSCRQKQYESFFIQLLSLPKGNFPAASA